MNARKGIDIVAALFLMVLAVGAMGWALWPPSMDEPLASEPLAPPMNAPTIVATSALVAESGTRFPTNIPMSPPDISAEVAQSTPEIAFAADTLSLATPTPSPIATRPLNTMGERFILVNQDEQTMHVFENGIEVKRIAVSTGRPVTNAFTPAWQGMVGDDWGSGAFRGTALFSDYMWFLFPGPEGSILIHSVPYRNNNGQKDYDRFDALGKEPVSNGCVRISPEDAAWLKTWNPVGSTIEITRWSGKISDPSD